MWPKPAYKLARWAWLSALCRPYWAKPASNCPIFILPPNFATWQERLIKRYGGDADQADIQKRMTTARAELQDALDKDYFEFVVNGDLAVTISVVDQIAHGSLSSKKNEQAKQIARDLIAEIDKAL